MPNLFGNGMLERARATSLALLGATTAVGLAMVALALNQGWPLIAGSSVPPITPQHQAVGRATIVAGLGLSGPVLEGAAVKGRDGGAVSKRGADSQPTGADSLPAAPKPSELVVVPSAPVKTHQHQVHEPVEDPSPTVAVQPAPSTAEGTAVALPTSSPAPPTSPPAAAPSPPDAATSEVPDNDSSAGVPSWSHGNGHGYGRDDDWDDDSHDWDDDGHSWDDDSHDWDSGGHGHWHGHDD